VAIIFSYLDSCSLGYMVGIINLMGKTLCQGVTLPASTGELSRTCSFIGLSPLHEVDVPTPSTFDLTPHF